ncbi:unnamed protein product [Ectocarpus sp. CCAP 1310/34]|nr:unnamed protein product [Ectocarpus sp. CCAP 1310/34]
MRTRRQTDGKGGAVSKLDIRGAAGGPSSPAALHGRLSSERPSSAILLATGSAASPGFAEASFEDEAGSLLSSSSVAAAGGHADGDEEEEAGTGDKGGGAHVVGPGELGIRGVEKDSVGGGGARDDKMEDAGGREDSDSRAPKRLKGGGEDEEAGMTIADRLEALSAAVDHEAERAWADKGGRMALAWAPGGEGGAVQPRAESLSTVLTQALQSGDESLLEQCLDVVDQGVIEATVERLPSSKVLQFLLRVVAKLEKRPNRAASLGRWIRALLSCHLGYLVSVPGLPEKLALLHQLIDRRVASFPKLIQLHGRLDLLLARAKAESSRRDAAGARAMDTPESVYREEDEDEEDDDAEEEEEEGGAESGEEDDSGEDEEEGSGDQQDMDEDDDDDDDDDDDE